jgi:hypothetical protein
MRAARLDQQLSLKRFENAIAAATLGVVAFAAMGAVLVCA